MSPVRRWHVSKIADLINRVDDPDLRDRILRELDRHEEGKVEAPKEDLFSACQEAARQLGYVGFELLDFVREHCKPCRNSRCTRAGAPEEGVTEPTWPEPPEEGRTRYRMEAWHSVLRQSVWWESNDLDWGGLQSGYPPNVLEGITYVNGPVRVQADPEPEAVPQGRQHAQACMANLGVNLERLQEAYCRTCESITCMYARGRRSRRNEAAAVAFERGIRRVARDRQVTPEALIQLLQVRDSLELLGGSLPEFEGLPHARDFMDQFVDWSEPDEG
jgi:hypothetical protein